MHAAMYRPVRRSRIHEIIVGHIEACVQNGTLKPGEKLPPEKTLAKQLGVSRISVREAITTLHEKGVVADRARRVRQGGFAPSLRCFRRSWSQHQLAAGVAQFDLSVGVAHVVEGEDSGDRNFQLAACDEVSQLGDYRRGRGIRAAF
jgi:DNA-binding transcriptional MocR family regulator